MGRVFVVLMLAWGLSGFVAASAGSQLSEGVGAYWDADYDRAERVLRSIDIWDLSDAEKVLLFKILGATKLAQGDSDGARQAFVDLLEVDPTYELSSTDFAPSVVAVFREAQGELANVFYERGMERYNDGDFGTAVELFEQALKADRNHPMAKEFVVIARERASAAGVAQPQTNPEPQMAEPGAPPITRLTPKHYRLATLEQGERPYVDRGFVFDSIPADYRDAQLVQTANDDKEEHGLNVSLEFERPATLYVAYDQRIRKKIDWLSGFNSTGKVVVISAGSDTAAFDIYSRDVTPGLVSVGPNISKQMRGGVAMYFLFAIPK
jgi:tetratricopeptide (TPR) repeat protein